jgi:hypothetical protein
MKDQISIGASLLSVLDCPIELCVTFERS